MNPGNSPSDKVQRYIEDFINRYQQGPQGLRRGSRKPLPPGSSTASPRRIPTGGQGSLRPHVTRGSGTVWEVLGPAGPTTGPRLHRPKPGRHRRPAARPRLPGSNDDSGTSEGARLAWSVVRQQWRAFEWWYY